MGLITISSWISYQLTTSSARTIKFLALAGLVTLCVTDTVTPLGFAHGTLYPLLVILVGLAHNRRWIIGVTLASIILTGLGFFLSPSVSPDLPISLHYVIANRLLSATVIAITGGLILLILQVIDQIKASQQTLSQTNDTLRSQQLLLQIASEVGHFGGWLVRLPNYEIIWSEELCRIHGVASGFSPTLEQAINFYAPEYRDRITEIFTACVHQGIPFDEELQIINTQGQQIWVRAIGQPVYHDQGAIVAVQGAFQDINLQKQTEASLKHSQQQFRQLADAMPQIVWTANPNGTIDYASNALRTYTGILEPQPHPSQAWLTLLHADDRAPCLAVWLEAVQTGNPFTFEFRLRRHDGDYCWHLSRALPIRDQSGQIIKWYGTATDIHHQKQLEQEARHLAQRLNTTLESITDAFITLDNQWRFTFINHQAERFLQRQRTELIGKVIWDEFPETVDSSFQHQYDKAVAEKQSVQFRELYVPLNRWLEIRAYPSTEGLAIYFQDVTERIALEEQLHQSQRLESVGQLTGGIAHDFNNLLTVILGNAELLYEALEDNPRLQPLAEMMSGAAQRGAELTQRLLAFARRQALNPQVVEVNQLIEQMDRLLRRTLGEHIAIEIVQDPELWTALVDPVQLESALLNLCLNARDAMLQGGQLIIETANTHLDQEYSNQAVEVIPGAYVMIAISDTGTGITPEHLERVFEPFFTTKAKGKGTGLGLSMVYGFVKQTGGHVSVYSEPGLGTTIRMYLPRSWGDTDQPTHFSQHQFTGGSELILLVEDDEPVRHYAQKQLEGLGYRVIPAAHGPEALQIIQQRDDIDLLFTDVIMPGGMSGRDLAETALYLRPKLKVLYTSGYTEDAIVHQGRLDAGVQLLSKPYSRAELAQKIYHALATGY